MDTFIPGKEVMRRSNLLLDAKTVSARAEQIRRRIKK